MSRVIFINRFFYPDEVATSLMLTDLATALAADGRAVCVVTSRLNHADPGVVFPAFDVCRGVKVRRVWTSRFGRDSLAGRACDYLSFYLSAFWCLVWMVNRADIVVAKTDPPMVSVIAAMVCLLKRARLVNWLQDIFPEAVIALGMRLPPAALRLLCSVRNWSVRRAAFNVVLGERMRERLLRDVPGLLARQVVVIPNWSRDADIQPIAAEQNPLRVQWGLQGAFVVGYSGNLGRAHEFDTFLNAAKILQSQERYADVALRVQFVFIGTGAGLAGVRQGAERLGLKNVQFRPFQPVSELGFSLSVPDVHLVSLLPSAEGLIVPSKYYGVAAVARACAFVGDTDGELARILRAADSGDSFEVGDARGLAEWLATLASDPVLCSASGLRARAWLDAQGGFGLALARWRLVLQQSNPTPVSQFSSFRD